MNPIFPVSHREGANCAQYDSLESLICLHASPWPPASVYQDERFAPGQQQIGLGICHMCFSAPSDVFWTSYTQDLPSCEHSICSSCVKRIMAVAASVCPFCGKPFHEFIRFSLNIQTEL